MSPALYAFIVSSRGGVSAAAIDQWARRQGLNPATHLRQVRRAAAAGQLLQRRGASYTVRHHAANGARVAVSVIYSVPTTAPRRDVDAPGKGASC